MLLGMAGWTSCAAPQPLPQDVVVLGLGNLSPDTLRTLATPGPDLPNFQRLVQESAAGTFSFDAVDVSNAGLWTTVTTGQAAKDHGVGLQAGYPATSHGLRVPALWHRVSAADQRVTVVGWPGTWPVDDVAGEMISQYAFLDSQTAQGVTRGLAVEPLLPHTVHPAHQETALRAQMGGLGPADDPYVEAARSSYLGASPSKGRPDLLMLYRPALSAQQADQLLGDLIENTNTTTRLMVIALPRPGLAADGRVFLRGPGIEHRATLPEAHLDGVAPTVLAWLGIALPADLPGRLFEEAFASPPTVTRVISHDPASDEAAADNGNAATVEGGLPRLGFLRGFPRFPPDDPEASKDTARLALVAGRADQAEAIYRRLLAVSPNDAILHRHLAAALGAQERYDEARDHIERSLVLAPLQPTAYHHRARLSELTGNNGQAYVDYKTALLLNPGFEGAIRGLERLGASNRLYPPRNPEDEEAARLIQSALEMARDQDYDHALEILEQAEDASPPYVLTYVVRANVYYLKGKIKEAIKAMELAVAVEPDNALFVQNLKRLQAEPPRKPPKGEA